jgi:glycosyltransferase involved in cell wall biosynthesis
VSTADGGLRIAICDWRDLRHPQGGGSELYVETIARGLAAAGNAVTLLTAAPAGVPRDELRAGVRYRRRGGPFTVYLWAALALLTRRVRADVVIDVQNAVPFLSPLVTRAPVVVVVHHVHREQWPVVYGRRMAALGWWVESRLAPRLYRRARYITVSDATRRELIALGVSGERISIVHNGAPARIAIPAPRTPAPHVLVLGRLVPHKRVEVVLEAVRRLRDRHPDLVVDVAGDGYWSEHLRAEAARLHVTDRVVFHGWVDEAMKARLLSQAWVNAVPSLKEGWGLSVTEAAAYAVPSIAFAGAGGLDESIVDGVTGTLVKDDFTAALHELLVDAPLRARLGAAAQRHAARYTWASAVLAVGAVLDTVLGMEPAPAAMHARAA